MKQGEWCYCQDPSSIPKWQKMDKDGPKCVKFDRNQVQMLGTSFKSAVYFSNHSQSQFLIFALLRIRIHSFILLAYSISCSSAVGVLNKCEGSNRHVSALCFYKRVGKRHIDTTCDRFPE